MRNVLVLLSLLCLLIVWPGGASAENEPILDVAKLPPLKPSGADAYAHRFLSGNLPRAYAIASDGSYGGQAGGATIDQARESALKSCAAKGGTDCAIYAEDLDVVWRGHMRVSRPEQPALITAPGYAFVPDARFLWRGPQVARGLVVWGHGYGGSIDDERGRQPPAFLRPLNNAGFDVVRFDRDPNWDHDIDRVVGWLRSGLGEMRRRGWRMVIAGGQSRGAWNAMELLRTPGAAEVVISASVAASGVSPGVQILRGETMFYSLATDIPRQATRLVFIQFREDPFSGDEERRARRVEDIIAPNMGATLLIDQPDGFKGHGGAYAAGFGDRYGECILHFATDTAPRSAC